MSDKKSLRALSMHQGKVYVYLKDDQTGEAFLRDAEAEGFTFGDGVKPTKRHYSSVMALKPDGTINYVGTMGMMAFGANADGLVRVDFAHYLEESEEYFL